MTEEMWDAYAGIYFPETSIELIGSIVIICVSIGAFIAVVIIFLKRK